MLLLAALCILIAAACLAIARRLSGQTGVRLAAAVLASDVGGPGAPTTLEAPSVRIRGRPDYVLRERERGRDRVYPVEVKPTRDSPTLFESDLVQLAAYMLLVEAAYGRAFVGYGIVRYRAAEFRVAWTPELRRRCLTAAEGVRAARQAADVRRSHSIVARCRGCAVRDRCSDALDE